jgi:hypothetical protein
MDERTPRPVDELRQQLKALGYLDARVDRFVIGRPDASARPLRFLAAASARIGILAGALLGPAAAVGVRLRVPELVTGAADAVVLALYFAVLFGIGAALASALAIAIGVTIARTASTRADFARRARMVAGLVGAVIGLVALVYLTLWWRAASIVGGTASLGWSAAVLAIAAAISLLLGHAVAATILAALARAGFGAALGRGVPLSSPRTTVPLGLVAGLGAVLLLVAAPGPEPRTTPPLTVVPTDQHLLVLAIDGLDVATITRLREAGRLPTFEALLSGAVAELASDSDRDPARVWTTIATGQPPERHGIRTLESRQVAGLEGRLNPASRWRIVTAATDLIRLTRPAIASGDERLIPAFWEVAARAGLRTAVVHWWATWPAPPDLGIVISDRAILRLEHQGALDGEIAPPELYESLRSTWTARRDRVAALAAEVIGSDAAPAVREVLLRSAALDATVLDVAFDSLLGALDLRTVYLPGLDIAQHTLLAPGDGGALTASVTADRLSAIERYYVALDRLIAGALARQQDAPRLTLLLGQPGRVAASSHGLLAVSGTSASSAHATAPATAVAATVLHALGVPIARELAAGPVTELFAAEFLRSHPVRYVESYGTRLPAARTGSGQALDREMVERMRSLGYVR